MRVSRLQKLLFRIGAPAAGMAACLSLLSGCLQTAPGGPDDAIDLCGTVLRSGRPVAGARVYLDLNLDCTDEAGNLFRRKTLQGPLEGAVTDARGVACTRIHDILLAFVENAQLGCKPHAYVITTTGQDHACSRITAFGDKIESSTDLDTDSRYDTPGDPDPWCSRYQRS